MDLLAPQPALDAIAPILEALSPALAPLTPELIPTGESIETAAEPVEIPSDGGSLNWFMIIVVAVVGVLTLIFSLYLIVIYQHPEDKNQAWFPKLVVLLGMTIAIYTVLMFPLDVTNSQVCDLNLPLVDCSTTFPMEQLWEAVYIANMILVFVLIPFAFFYYEGDSEWCVEVFYIRTKRSYCHDLLTKYTHYKMSVSKFVVPAGMPDASCLVRFCGLLQ